MRGWLIAGLILLAVVIGIQFVPVDRSDPPVRADLQATPEVHAVFRRCCYDCHSNQTRWPWYSHIAPVSWMLAGDVHGGRRHLNFSEWGMLDPALQARRAEHVWEMVDSGEMPLRQYLLIHRDARPSAADKALIRGWAESYGPIRDSGRD